jgi:hypothetical protein
MQTDIGCLVTKHRQSRQTQSMLVEKSEESETWHTKLGGNIEHIHGGISEEAP